MSFWRRLLWFFVQTVTPLALIAAAYYVLRQAAGPGVPAPLLLAAAVFFAPMLFWVWDWVVDLVRLLVD